MISVKSLIKILLITNALSKVYFLIKLLKSTSPNHYSSLQVKINKTKKKLNNFSMSGSQSSDNGSINEKLVTNSPNPLINVINVMNNIWISMWTNSQKISKNKSIMVMKMLSLLQCVPHKQFVKLLIMFHHHLFSISGTVFVNQLFQSMVFELEKLHNLNK